MNGGVLYRIKTVGPGTVELFTGKQQLPKLRFNHLSEGEPFDFRAGYNGYYFEDGIYVRCEKEPKVWARGGTIYWNGKQLKAQDPLEDIADLGRRF